LEAGARIEALRERGDHRLDPVRFRFIEVLARRAAQHEGEARRFLDDRLATLLEAYGDKPETSWSPQVPVATPEAPRHRGALAELLDHIGELPVPNPIDRAIDGAMPRVPPGMSPLADLKALSHFRDTWSKLRTHRRLLQSLASVPKNAGPLNSHHLVHQSLTLMLELSPAYLNRFMRYVDTLMWFDQVNRGDTGAGKGRTTRPAGRSK
jgi:hypothetical protein